MSTDTHTSLLTVHEAAEVLHCSALTVRRRLRDGDLPALQLGGPGKAIRIDGRELRRHAYGSPPETRDQE